MDDTSEYTCMEYDNPDEWQNNAEIELHQLEDGEQQCDIPSIPFGVDEVESLQTQQIVKRPPSPQKDQRRQKKSNTMWDFLTYMKDSVSVRIDDYGGAKPRYSALEGSKIPTTALKVISDLMVDWYNLTIVTPGADCLFTSLQCAYGRRTSSSTRRLQPAVWKALTRFFRSFEQPFTSVGTQNDSTSSESPRNKFDDIQKTYVGKKITSRSDDTSGSTIVRLEIYQRSVVENTPLENWWTLADFRGLIMTSRWDLIQQAVDLQSLMEKEFDSRSTPYTVQSPLSPIYTSKE